MFGPKVRKYLVLNSSDDKKHYYQALGQESGLAKCPTNPKKSSEVACSVKFSLEFDEIRLIRIVCSGPPVLTAAGNYVALESKGKDLNYLTACSTVNNMSNVLEVTLEIGESQGLWIITDAVSKAIENYNNFNK